MCAWVLRQDDVELSGSIVWLAPTADPSNLSWTVIVQVDPGQEAFLTHRSGAMNPSHQIRASVSLPAHLPNVPNSFAVMSAMFGMQGQKARVVGSWGDNDFSMQTELQPLLAVIVEFPIAVYDENHWAVAVRDLDVFAFAHDPPIVLGQPAPLHAGESRTVLLTLASPRRPTALATPFFRRYRDGRLDFVQSSTFGPPRAVASGDFVVDVEIVTGPPDAGQGFSYSHVALTYDEDDLADLCPLGRCEDEQHHCRATGETRFTWVPPHVPEAKAGYLALSPGDGKGLVSGIVAALTPPQVYDHMGIFVDNGWTVRHCTSSQDRYEDDKLWSATVKVNFLGSVDVEKVPLGGLRADHIRFGWPGSITQTVEEVYYTGRNSLNDDWLYGADAADPEPDDPSNPGPFHIYQLEPGARRRRVAFIDPEPTDRADLLTRLQDTPVPVTIGEPPVATMFFPTLVRPPAALAANADPALARVAKAALSLRAHYRFFGYTNTAIAVDPAFVPSPGSFSALPAGASWPAGTIPAMCSSFIWAAVQRANEHRPPGTRAIQLEDRFDAEDASLGREYGAGDGTYRYDEAERLRSATRLFGKLQAKIKAIIDGKLSGIKPWALASISPGTLVGIEIIPSQVAHQICNSFAVDASEEANLALWQHPGAGDAVSPDNVRDFWDFKAAGRPVQEPTDTLAVYGDAPRLAITPGQWRTVPVFRKAPHALGHGTLICEVRQGNVAQTDATIQIDFGCVTLRSTPVRQAIALEEGTHFIDAWEQLPDPNTGDLVLFRTSPGAQKFDITAGATTVVVLRLEPPPDLWRVLDVHLTADVHDRSFWGGDADARAFDVTWPIELRDDVLDDPSAPADQRNSKLQDTGSWRTEPEVGSGVHVTVTVTAVLHPADRSIACHVVVSLVDVEQGETDQTEVRDVTVLPDAPELDVLDAFDFSSDETVPERARVSLRLRNRVRAT